MFSCASIKLLGQKFTLKFRFLKRCLRLCDIRKEIAQTMSEKPPKADVDKGDRIVDSGLKAVVYVSEVRTARSHESPPQLPAPAKKNQTSSHTKAPGKATRARMSTLLAGLSRPRVETKAVTTTTSNAMKTSNVLPTVK